MRSNEEWLRALRADASEQASALADLRAYLSRVLPSVLERRGGAPGDLVEDVVQETLIRALDHLDEFEGRSRFTTWVTTIAVRLAATELRRRRWKDVSIDDLTAGSALIPAQHVDPQANPEVQTAQRRIIEVMHDVLESQLTRRQRVAIVGELSGAPQEEIGRHLGITRNAVYKLGYDARKKLKLGLEAAGFDSSAIRSAFSGE